MKKKMFLALLGMSCLLLTSISVQAQVSRNGGKGKTTTTEVNKEESNTQTSGTNVSRKKAPDKTSTTKDQPVYRQEDAGVSRERSGSQMDRTSGTVKGRRTIGNKQPQRFEYKLKSGKAKCGVAGCNHPGKHKGLHKKQQRKYSKNRKQ